MPETVYNDGSYLTQKGNNLIAKLIASGEGLQFTRVSVGDGSLPLGTSPDSMTSLGHEVMNGSIASITNSNNGEVSIVAQVSSIGVETGFSVTELGLWATDPDEGEILYTYLSLQEHPEWIRPDGESVNKFAVFTLVIIVAGIQIVSATISQNAFATLEDLQEYASLDLLSSYEGASMIGNEAIGDIQEGTISEQLVTILGRINYFSTLFSSKTHSHGSITNDGKIGTDANKAVYTGEGGALQAGTLPVSAGGTGATTSAGALANLGAQAKRLTFTNKTVATSAWASDTTYADFPFRAAVPCTGVTESMFVQVVLAPEDATGGNFAPVCRSYTGGVYLYAKATPEAEITIPTIVAWG